MDFQPNGEREKGAGGAGDASLSRPPPVHPHTPTLTPPSQVIDRPDICVTVASSFPDRLRLLKRVRVFPLSLTLRCDYVRRTRQFECGCSAKVRARERDSEIGKRGIGGGRPPSSL